MSATDAPVIAPSEVIAEAATEPVPEAVNAEPVPNGADASLPDESVAPTDSLQRAQPNMAANLIAASSLPPALRERLAQLIESRSVESANGSPSLPLETTLRAIEQALPEFLRSDRGSFQAAAHPTGDVFFHGQADELSDSEAEEVARQQLSRSGLLRGQRVRAE